MVEAISFTHRLRWLPLLILCIGLWLTWLQHAGMDKRQQELARARFEMQAREVVFRLERRLQANVDVLHGVTGLFAASGLVERGEFRAYVETLRLDVHYPGIQGVGFSQWVATPDIPRLEAAIRAEGFPQFRVHPLKVDAAHQSAIVFIEPFDWRNQRAFGFDMFSEPIRQQAMRRAVETGEPSFSGRVTLVQETEEAPPARFSDLSSYLSKRPSSCHERRTLGAARWLGVFTHPRTRFVHRFPGKRIPGDAPALWAAHICRLNRRCRRPAL